MSYRESPAGPALAGVVSVTWVHRVEAGAAPYRHRSIPNGSVELLCHLGATPRLVGPLTRPRTEVLPPGTTVVGVRFRPGAAAAVLGLPAAELADLVVDAGEVWGRAIRDTGSRMAEASTVDNTVPLQRFVAGRLTDGAAPDPLVAEAVRRLTPWHGDVGTLRSSLAISERQFRRRCQATIGVAPKALQRMLRFQGFLARTQFALSRGRSPARGGLARLAADTGYADQAHLTRECLRLTGRTPRAFLLETEEQCGGGHDHEVSFTPLLAPDGRFVQERRPARS